MKLAQVYCARATGATFSWKWRSVDGKQESRAAFDYYHDCLEDARKHGFTAEFSAATKVPKAPIAPSGKRAK